jgi:uncharacterized membrane protein
MTPFGPENATQQSGVTPRRFASRLEFAHFLSSRLVSAKEKTMNTLIVVGYDDPLKAEEVKLKLLKMQKDYLIDLEDAAFAVKDKSGKVRLHQAISLTAAGALSGGFWGSLMGLIFLNPLLGMAVGATAGAVSGALADVGINDKFMKELAATLKPESSVLFVLVRKATPDRVLEELAGTGGKVLKSSLSHENEKKLQAALNSATPQLVEAGA